MRWTIPALLFVLLLPAESSALRLRDRLPVVTDRFLVECPAGTRRRARSLRRNILQQRVTIEQPTWEVRCETSKAIANGPAVRVRHSYRTNQLALANASFFLAHRLVWAGTYRNGKRHGTWKQFSRKGEHLGSVEMNVGTGVWRGWRADGELAAQGEMVSDLEHGEWSYWYADAQLAMKGSFARGAREGRWRRFNRDTSLRSDVSFVGGQRHGLSTEWHSNGEKRFEGGYHKGIRDGSWAYWNARGELLGINVLDKGTGRWMEWRDNGELRSSGFHKSGRRHGHWTFYGRDGRLTEEGDYNGGGRVRSSWKRHSSNSHGRTASALKARSRLKGLLGRRRIKSTVLGRAATTTLRILGGGGLTVRGGGSGIGPRGSKNNNGSGISGRVRGSTGGGRRAGLSRFGGKPSRLPVVKLALANGGGAKAVASILKRSQARVRFCTVAFDIKRLRKAARAGAKRHPTAIRGDAVAMVRIDSIGRASTVRITRSAKHLDTAWHQCVSGALKLLRFTNVPNSGAGASVEVAVSVQ